MAEKRPVHRDEHKRALGARLARIEGQVRGVRRMMEEDAPCEDVAQQLAAARKALNRCFYEMMACAIEQEVLPEREGIDAEAAERLDDLVRVLARYG